LKKVLGIALAVALLVGAGAYMNKKNVAYDPGAGGLSIKKRSV
jgi:hypothetical protein